MSISRYERISARRVMGVLVCISALLTALSLWKDILPSPTRAAWNVAVAELPVIKKPLNGFYPSPDLAYAMNMDRKG